jgi:ADP-ribose pyrophosphatase YjhB (NUDIX family)
LIFGYLSGIVAIEISEGISDMSNMMTAPYCANCNAGVPFDTGAFPYLCEKCNADPYRINLLRVNANLLDVVDSGQLTVTAFPVVLRFANDRKRTCDTNPAPVIIGLIFTELHETGGKVLLIQRAIPPSIGEWALVSGFIIDTLDWQGNLRKEADEEASVTLSTESKHMYPFTFSANTPRTNLLLNFAVVQPEGVTEIKAFDPDHETSARQEFEFNRDVRPPFCFPIHAEVFNQFCARHFGW